MYVNYPSGDRWCSRCGELVKKADLKEEIKCPTCGRRTRGRSRGQNRRVINHIRL